MTVSVVVCTYNRAQLLIGALQALVRQAAPPRGYEIVVVDNNSTDGTRQAVQPFLADPRVRYVFEAEQGLATARNRGIGEARGDVVAFTDDDVRVDTSWVATIAAIFDAHPEVAFAGGRVLPVWASPPPEWLDAAGHAPLALVDYGDEPAFVDPDRPVCLVGANVAVRRSAFDRVGGFSTRVQLCGEDAGSTEDHELELRLLAAGFSGYYDPALVVRAPVPEHRLQRRYHRTWHLRHGRRFALMREPRFERSRLSALGIPAHVYRSALRESLCWLRDAVSGRAASAFAHELRLRFLLGFASQRVAERRHG